MQKQRDRTYMDNNERQANISMPSSIFSKFRAKAAKQPIRGDDERKHAALKPCIPKIDDEDIMELCKRYPIKVSEDDDELKKNTELKGKQLNMQKLQIQMKRKQDALVGNIEKSLKTFKKEEFDFNFQQLLNEFKDQELDRNQRLLEEVNQAD